MKKILVIRFSSIGDIVLTSPVLRCLHEQLGAELHVVTRTGFKGILEHNPHVKRVYAYADVFAEIKAEMKAENYDFIVDLHHNARSQQVKLALRKPSATFPKLNVKKWLLVNLHVNRMPAVHIVDRYFEAVKKLGVKNDGKGLDYFISAQDEVNLQSLPETHRNGYIAFVAGAKFATKQMPEEKAIAVIRKLDSPVVLLGGKEDETRAARITAACGSKVYNACGKYNLNQSASLVRQSDLVITPDTGLMHIAAAFKKKIYSVWGNTVPAFGMYPYLPGEGSRIIEVKNLSCRPCSKIGYEKCPKGHFDCMRKIDETEFFNGSI
ncbi:MAG: glycosyl transferase family protein [Bacteroidetes bacterium]|nr:MAG: glycosyl transferase family protein [Bacteroidota bacterium]